MQGEASQFLTKLFSKNVSNDKVTFEIIKLAAYNGAIVKNADFNKSNSINFYFF